MGQSDDGTQEDLDQSTYQPSSPENAMDQSMTNEDQNENETTHDDSQSGPSNEKAGCSMMKLPIVTSSNWGNDVTERHKEPIGYHGENGYLGDKLYEKNGILKENEEMRQEVKEIEEKEDNWFSWVIAACAALIYMCNGGVFYSNGLLLPEFIRMLDCGEVVGTWVSSVQMGMCQFVALLGGALIELYGCRAVSLTGSSLITIGLILSSFVTSVPLFFLTYSIIPGIGLGLQFMPCIVVVQYHFTAKRRATATGLVSAGSPLGIFVFAVLTRYLLDTYAVRGTLMILGALNAHALPMALIIWPCGVKEKTATPVETPDDEKESGRLEIIEEEEEPQKSNEPQKSSEISTSVPNTSAASDKPTTRETCMKHIENVKKHMLSNAKELARTLKHVLSGIQELRDVTVAVMFLACVTFCIGYQTPFIFMPITAELRGHGPWKGAYLVSVIGIADATARVLMGFLGSVLPVSRTLMVAFGCLVAGIACCTGGYLHEYTPLVVACVAYGAGAATQTVLLAPVLVDLLGLERIARLFGLANVGYGIGFLCSPPLQAFLYRVTKNISLPFYFGGIAQILASVCVLVVYLLHVRCRRRMKPDEPQLQMKKYESKLLSNVSLADRSIHEKDFDAYSHHSYLRSMTSLGDPNDPNDLKVPIGSLHNMPVVTVFGSTISLGSHISADPSRVPWYASVTSLERGHSRV